MGLERNILMTIQYDGRKYHGWQVQQNAVTVQEVFQDAIQSVTGLRHDVKGCSRTDSGVHAFMYVLNFRTECTIPPEKLRLAVQHFLPDDIAVLDCREVPYDFHARYACAGKEYVYKIWNSPLHNPFLKGLALFYPYPLDEKMLNICAADYIGTHDFAAFCASGSSVLSTVRTVTDLEVTRQGSNVTMRVRADGFLYNMVRIMVGTLLDISQGKIGRDEIPSILLSCDRERAGVTAPPQGLYLNRVFYPAEALELKKD